MTRTFRIPVGPQHPGFKEPMRLDICVDGEKVISTDIVISFNHRGIEKAAESRTYLQDIYLIERVCGICSHSHTTSYCQAVEEILGLKIPARAQYIRSFIGELERIQSHFLWLGIAGHEIGWDTLLMYSWRDREKINDMLERISGNRVHYAMNTIGGVRRDIAKEDTAALLEGLRYLEERNQYYIRVITEEETFLERTRGVGYLAGEVAKSLCAVGPTVRASGIRRDVRADDPYAAYPDLDFSVVTSDACDVWGRTIVKTGEVIQSIRMCRQILDELPAGDIRVRPPAVVPAGEAVSRYEAPRGELLYYVKSGGGSSPERVKIRTPTLANWMVSVEMLRGIYIADVPIVVDAIDPCLSCSSRITLTDHGRKGSTVTTIDALRRERKEGGAYP